MNTDGHRFLKPLKMQIAIASVVLLTYQLKAQTVTSTASSPSGAQTQAITNKQGKVFSARDVKYLHSLGYSDEQIVEFEVIEQPKTNSVELVPTPPDLKNAIVYLGNFMGNGKTGLPADTSPKRKIP